MDAQLMLLVTAPPPITFPSDVVNDFINAGKTWEPMIRNAGLFVFVALATIAIVWNVIKAINEGHDFPAIALMIMRMMVVWGVALGFLTQGWGRIILDGFIVLGRRAGGVTSSISPSGVFAEGANIMGALWKSAFMSNWMAIPLTNIPYTLAGIVILASFALLSLHFCKFLIEGYTAVSVGLFMCALAPLEATEQYYHRYITLILAAGMRLQIFYLLVGMANTLGNYWIKRVQQLNGLTDPIGQAFVISGECFVFGTLAWAAPEWITSKLQGTVSMSGSHLIGFLTPFVQAGVVGMGMATTFAAGGMSAMANATPGPIGSMVRAFSSSGPNGNGNGGGSSPQQPSSPGVGSRNSRGFGRGPRQPTAP